ncbi:MAG: chromosome segregation protein SMC [Candidatus Woesearchaeota archaeon]
MTLIKSITMEGFKSFAKRTDLFFGEKFNVILGPNGSGKSNITDALCFVLGRLGSKSLRAEKTSNLIYNGGKKKEPAKKALVSVVFDNSKKAFPIEGDEVKITRIVRQDGQSIYKINDKRVTRQQIIELLSYAKIDPEGYNIILQGDIVRFVSMSSIEMKQIIEEIAGISLYEERKQKSLNELQRVEERLKEAEIILAERKTYLKELKDERDQALKYKELKDTLEKSKATLVYLQLQSKEKEIEKINKESQKSEEELKKVGEEIETLKKSEEEIKSKVSEITREIEEKSEKEQLDIHKSVEELKVIIATAEINLKNKKSEIERLKERREQLNVEIKSIEEEITNLSKEIESLKSEKEGVSKEIADIEKHVREFEEEHNIEKVVELEKEVENLDSNIENLQKEVQQLIEEKQKLMREKDKTEVRIEEIERQIEKVKIVEEEHKKEIEELKSKKEEFKQTILELNKLLNKDSELAAKNLENRKLLGTLRESYERLKIRSMSMQEKLKQDIAIRKILEQKDKLGKIYGTAFQLGSVEPKYSLALEVAAGNRINSIVTDNDETAAKCIKYLKENKFGYATFLPLNKLKKADFDDKVKELLKTKGVVGFAVDFVKCDSKFKKVFNYVFSDTIIVEGIDVARRIGIGSARMVTLDGDLVEKSGVMHGGFKKAKAVFQTTEEAKALNELEDLENKISVLEKEIRDAEEEREKNEKEIQSLREKKAIFEGEILKAEKSLHLEESDLDVSKRQKALLKEELEKTEKRISELSKQIDSKNLVLNDCKIKKQELRKKISELRNPILLAELAAFNQKKSELQNNIARIEEKINSKAERIKNLENEKEKIIKIQKQLIRDEKTIDEELKNLSKEVEDSKKKLSEKEKLQKGFYEKFKKLFEERNKLTDKIQEFENQIVLKEDAVRRTEQKINNLSLKRASLLAEQAALEREFKFYEGVEIIKNRSESDLKFEVEKCEKIIAEMGNINLKALDVYEKIEKEYNSILEKKEKLSSEKNDVLKMIEEIEVKKKELFLKTFDVLNENFKKFFSKLSAKGEAFLKLENEENPLEEGVVIRVKITSQKFLDIRALSGGEKALTALALIFAIQEFQPAPFYIMDEVEAALDKKNSEQLAKLIREYSERAQYIVISHNDAIISEADTLFGISMDEDGVSKVVSLKV